MRALFTLFHSALDQLLWLFQLMAYNDYDEDLVLPPEAILAGAFIAAGLGSLVIAMVPIMSIIGSGPSLSNPFLFLAGNISGYLIIGICAQIVLRKTHNVHFIENRFAH